MRQLVATCMPGDGGDGDDEDVQADPTEPAIVNRVTGQVVQAGNPALPAKVVPLEIEVPAIVDSFDRLLKEHQLADHTKTGFVVLNASFQVDESAVRRGTLSLERDMNISVGGELKRRIFIDSAHTTRREAHALSVVLTAFDMSEMPFDCQLSMRGFRLAQERRLGQRQQSDACLRDYILLAKRKQQRGQRRPDTLLVRPLVCQCPLTGTRFGSIEATGFKSTDLFQKVVELVDESSDPERAGALAKLFGRRRSTLGDELFDSAVGSSADGHASTKRFYLLPYAYQYTALIVRVHTYLTMRALRQSRAHSIPEQSIDFSLYELPFSSKHLIVPADELQMVVAFIDNNLVDVHPTFDPLGLGATLAPFGYPSWTEAWNANVGDRRARKGYKEAVFKCNATLIVFYAFLEPQSPPVSDTEAEADESSRSAHKMPPYEAEGSASSSDDDDESVIFSTLAAGGGATASCDTEMDIVVKSDVQ